MSAASTPSERSDLIKRLRVQWGFAALGLLSLFALVRLLRQAVPGHYRVFTSAAHALWHGQYAYGTDFGTQVGYFFYSPTCALFVFGPFSLLPERLGLALYMLLSWGVFVWGAKKFYEQFALPPGSQNELASQNQPGWAEPRVTTSARLLQWFWIAVSPQVFGAILASKLELMITGLLLASISWLASAGQLTQRSQRLSPQSTQLVDTQAFMAAGLLALILNWKFQPLPVIGLAMLTWIYTRRDWKIPLTLAASLGFFYLLPYAFLPREFLLQNQQIWSETFSQFVGESVLNFENVFAFLNHAFDLPISFVTSQLISASVGLGLAGFVGAWLIRENSIDRKPTKTALHNSPALLQGGLLLSTALGSMFMTAFSPLGQNNALVLYAPLLLSGFVCLSFQFTLKPATQRWIYILAGVFAVMTLSYSDLVPLALRNHLRFLSIKPLACLALGVAVATEAWRGRLTLALRSQ